MAGIVNRFPRVWVLVVAEKFEKANAFPLLRLGAKGLLSYAEALQRLPQAVAAVAAGGFWVPRSLLSHFLDSVLESVRGRRLVSNWADLSPREQETLNVLLQNQSNKEIASRLKISERTVKFYVSKLLTRFGVQRRSDLILQYLQLQPEVPPLSHRTVLTFAPKLAG